MCASPVKKDDHLEFFAEIDLLCVLSTCPRRDLAERLAGLVKLGNLAALFQAELAVVFAHCNTLSWCCTSFVNSGGPLMRPERSFALRAQDDNYTQPRLGWVGTGFFSTCFSYT